MTVAAAVVPLNISPAFIGSVACARTVFEFVAPTHVARDEFLA
eukprot:CAMPEP_0177511468 /NCGR_PEP_ID=MMETSP0369-20130122/42694_1 /TAXON_ID=447022 ORGANISM="Scrippsiella hangoei-like, Strain SHHI-4" /NCGR_SAMPLE_ID=MMETSP0369 /ASSEMBLY_ACC=CAM_ASM_000364 /LENGTH=42 /DNA_ID= /DNA_START= /DNA_END= /DNA_ORIENTATION=